MQSMIGKGRRRRTQHTENQTPKQQKSEEQTMKKLIFTLGLAIATTAALGTAQAEEGLDLAKKSGSLACHSVDKKVVGHAWKDVAEEYKGQKEISATLTDGTVEKGSPK